MNLSFGPITQNNMSMKKCFKMAYSIENINFTNIHYFVIIYMCMQMSFVIFNFVIMKKALKISSTFQWYIFPPKKGVWNRRAVHSTIFLKHFPHLMHYFYYNYLVIFFSTQNIQQKLTRNEDLLYECYIANIWDEHFLHVIK